MKKLFITLTAAFFCFSFAQSPVAGTYTDDAQRTRCGKVESVPITVQLEHDLETSSVSGSILLVLDGRIQQGVLEGVLSPLGRVTGTALFSDVDVLMDVDLGLTKERLQGRLTELRLTGCAGSETRDSGVYLVNLQH